MMVAFAFSSQAAYYLVGQAPFGNGWNPADGVEMTANADGTYSFKATVNGSLWFVFADALAESSSDWATFNNTMRIGPTGGDEEVIAGQWTTFQKAEGDHGAYKFTGSGNEYTITLNPFSHKFKIDGYVEPIVIDTYTVAGTPASVFGTEWDAANTDNDMTLMDDGMYQLDKNNVALGAGSELQFKVVGNHDWGNSWPDENRTITLDQSGIYNLRFTFDPSTTFCGVQASLVGNIDTNTGDLFILGDVNENTWAANIGLQMDTEDQNIFKATFTTKGESIDENDGIGYSYFSFTTKLAENEDWSTIQAYRLGAIEENYLLSEDQLGIEQQLGANTNSFKIPAGTYEATVNLSAKTLVITKAAEVEVTATPVITYEVTDDEVIITVTGDGEVHVYVDGVEVENPYIIPRGDEDVTVVVTATAQEEGKEISETATEEITIPAKPAPEVTATPVITYEVTDDEVIITVTGDGEVHVYVDGVEVENPYTIARGEEDVVVVITATAQEEGKLISETATEEITVPAKETVEPNDYKIEPLWVIDDLSFLPVGDVRQGFGMNGKFYINNKADQKILVIDQDGLLNTEYPGGANCGMTRDEAGNLVVSHAQFPNAWGDSAIVKVINPVNGEMKEYSVPVECGIEGRCDFLGFAKGNLMEDGVIFLTGAANSGVSIMTIAGGEVIVDECYIAPCDGLSPTSSTVINYYTDLAGEDALLYVTRNAALVKIGFDGSDLVPATLTLPGKGACNGTFPFIWDEKEFFVYPTLPNYLDGFAVAEAGAEAPIVEIPAVAAANANAYQADWLNAEICTDKNDKEYVTIYQYYPGGRIAVYMLYKGDRPEVGGIEEMISDNNKVVAGQRFYNIMGQEMKEANGLTIIVTTYTDGSSSAVKVIK